MMLKKQGTKRNVHNIKCWELIRQRMLCFNDLENIHFTLLWEENEFANLKILTKP